MKKRKPFDSAKQRIQGTELAEFLPKQQQQQQLQQQQSHNHTNHHLHYNNTDHHHHRRRESVSSHHKTEEKICNRKSSNAWKQTRDEFLKAIRAARGDTVSLLFVLIV